MIGIALAALILTSIPVKTLSQDLPAPERVLAEKTMTGQLVKVDTQTKIIGIRGPDQKDVTFTYDFFDWKHLRGTITDTHFAQRDRMGRTLAFLARQIKDKGYKSVLSIAVNEKTSVTVDKKGLARVVGNGPAYFILADHKPEQCEPGKPLAFSNYKVWRIHSGQTFDLKNRPTKGFYTVSVTDGKLTSNPY